MSLKDIAPLSEIVEIRGEKITVTGINNKGIAYLWQRFPIITELLKGGAKPEDIIEKVPEALAAIIAAGCGYPGDKEAEAAVDNLSVDDTTYLLSLIMPMTWPRGFGPFVENLTRMGLLMQQPALEGGKSKTVGTSPEA